MPINKLEQLRKYIFDIDIEIERIQSKQVSNPKVQFVGIGKTLSIKKKVYHTGITRSYDFLIERNNKKMVCCCHFETI